MHSLSARNRSTLEAHLPSRTLFAIAAGTVLALAPHLAAQHYQQTNLVSDVSGLATTTDAHLVNPWGLSRSATSPWWASDNGTGLSTLYNGTGVPQALVVTIPGLPGSSEPSAPTGTVFNGSNDFQVGTNQPARFLFVTQEGTLAGWNPGANPTVAIQKVVSPGASYFGLALGVLNGANYLYAANFASGAIDVFDTNFAPVNLGAGAFRDPRLPPHYAPFNVQAIGDKIFVAYARRDEEEVEEVTGPGRGFVNAYSTGGALLMRLQWGPWMNAPWGLVQAPADFGKFSNMILVGQFGSGKIAAFDPVKGHFRGLMRGVHGRPVRIEGLWALSFGNGASAGPANSLYFTAGIDDEAHGLFGTLTALADEHGHGHADDDEKPGHGNY